MGPLCAGNGETAAPLFVHAASDSPDVPASFEDGADETACVSTATAHFCWRIEHLFVTRRRQVREAKMTASLPTVTSSCVLFWSKCHEVYRLARCGHATEKEQMKTKIDRKLSYVCMHSMTYTCWYRLCYRWPLLT